MGNDTLPTTTIVAIPVAMWRRHLLNRGLLRVEFDLMAERQSLDRLVQKYADLPMSLADACLVRMTELNDKAVVCTLDRHFQIYRKHGRQTIPTIMP